MKRSHEEEVTLTKRFDPENHPFDVDGYKKYQQAKFELLVSKLKEKKKPQTRSANVSKTVENSDFIMEVDEWRMKGF
jgi:hypothetical protein